MTKSNDKKNRQSGVTNSNGIKFPQPMTGSNSPTADLEYTDKERMEQHNNTNRQL